MARHVKILAILHIVFSAIGLVAGIVVLLIFGGLAGLVSTSGIHPPDQSVLGFAILGGIGGLIFLIIFALSLPGLIGGIGLLRFKPWARLLMIAISGLDLLGVPLHTALGIYGLWVLLNRETEQLFTASSIPTAPRM